MKKKWPRSFFLVVLLTGIIWSQEAGEARADELSLPEVVITDSRIETLMKNAAGFVSVIRGEEIRGRLETVSEAVGWAVGTNLLPYGSLGAITSNQLRGSTNDQVLVLLDGVRLNTAQGGGFDLGMLASAPVERIEVLRGGASALYGTNAVGGVINIVTRRPTEKPENHLDLSWGSDLSFQGFNTYTASLGRSQKLRNLSYQFDFTHQQSEGNFQLGPYSYQNPAGNEIKRMDNNAYQSEALFLRLGLDRKAQTFELTNDFYQGRKELPGMIPDSPTPEAEQKDLRNLVSLSGRQSGWWGVDSTLGGRIYFGVQQRNYFDNVYVLPEYPEKHTNYGLGGEIKLDYGLGSRQLLTVAPEIKREWIESSRYLEGHQRITTSIFLQDRVNLFSERFFLVPAFRFDYHDDFGGAWSPKIGAVMVLLKDLRLKMNAGQSFRAPSFDDLYWPEDAYSKGNPDLKPEKAFNLDGGFSFQIEKKFALEMAGFYNQIKDLIQWAPGNTPDGKWAPENVGKAQFWGIESNLVIRPFSFLSLTTNHTYLQAQDHSGRPGENGKNLIYRPRNRINVSLDGSWKIFRAFGEVKWVDRRYTGFPDPISNKDLFLESYGLFNLGLGMTIRKNVKVVAKIKNITNERFEEMKGYPQPGREYALSFSTRF